MKRTVPIWVLALVVIVAIGADLAWISAFPRQSSAPAMSRPAPPPELEAPASVPLTSAFVWETAGLAPGGPVQVTMWFIPWEAACTIQLNLTAEGNVALEGTTAQEWTNLSARQKIAVPFTVRSTGAGAGKVTVKLRVLDAAGNVLYGNTPVLSLYNAGDDLLVGVSGTTALKLEYLDRQKSAGKLTPEQYQQARERVLSGGD